MHIASTNGIRSISSFIDETLSEIKNDSMDIIIDRKGVNNEIVNDFIFMSLFI